MLPAKFFFQHIPWEKKFFFDLFLLLWIKTKAVFFFSISMEVLGFNDFLICLQFRTLPLSWLQNPIEWDSDSDLSRGDEVAGSVETVDLCGFTVWV